MSDTLIHERYIKIERTLEGVEDAKQMVQNFLTENNINEDLISHFELSVYEAAVNVVEHGDREFNNHPIHIHIKITSVGITAKISSIGEKFDPLKKKLPDIVNHYKSGSSHGLGIYFIRTLMDKVNYSREGDMNVLTLTKNNNV